MKTPEDSLFLPNFCSIRAVFVTVLVAELLALVLTLAMADRHSVWEDLGVISLFVQWLVLLCAAALCILRRLMIHSSNRLVMTLSYLLILAVTVLVSEASYWLFQVYPISSNSLLRYHGDFLLRNIAMAAILGAMVLRYLYIQHQWKIHLQAESRARIQALQARIRPHFLFNSMNVIASLTRSEPALAEQTVEDLAELFRASLTEATEGITLADELNILQRYIRIEQLRLGDRLRVIWDIESLPRNALVPALLLQPLVENAVYHGIETREDGGEISICGKFDQNWLTIVLENPISIGHQANPRTGNRLAMDNIRQRLEVFYEQPGMMQVEQDDTLFRVILRIPYQVKTA
jgi:two-component system sensor histidine kinase AlgZ